MSEHAKQAMFDNIRQNLVELMVDYLDSESRMIISLKMKKNWNEFTAHVKTIKQ